MKKLSFFLMAMLVSLTSFAAALGDGYEKVTNISNLTTGDRVVVYADAISKGVTGWNGSKDATVAESGWVEYLVEVASGGVYLKDETADNYIASPGNSNQFKYGTKAVCSVDANGVLKCNNRFLCQNSTYYRMYTSVGSYKPFYVYKVIADAGGDETEDLGDALKWSATSATVQMGADDNEYPTLTNDKNVDVIYSSESEAVATIDANGVVTLVKEGTTTISALYEGGEIDGVTYSAKNVSYTLTVKPAPLVIEPIEGGIIDVLTHKTLAATSSSYTNFTGKQAANENHSDAVYAGRSARNGNATQYSIQLNTIDKGRIATTTSGGIAKRVYVKWSTQPTLNTNARALNIYGSNDAFTGSETAAPSTKIGTITFTTGAAEAYVDLEGDYKHILITGSGAIYMDEIQVTWVADETPEVPTIDAPTFSLAEDTYTEAQEVTLSAEEGTIYYTLDGTTPDAESIEYTDPIVLDECGTTTIKAIAISGETISSVASATYTIQLPLNNSQANPYTEAEAIEVYNGGCYDNQEVYVKGVVKTAQFYKSNTYTITLEGGFQFYKFYEAADEVTFTEDYIVEGDTLVACGKLVKYGETYELGAGCYLVERKPYSAPKVDISNTKETAYTVAEAIALIDDITSDLTKQVYVKGEISEVESFNETYGSITYWIQDEEGNKFECYGGLGLDQEKFTSVEDLVVGSQVIVYGTLTKYKSIYEFNANNYLVEYVAPEPEIPTVTLSCTDMDKMYMAMRDMLQLEGTSADDESVVVSLYNYAATVGDYQAFIAFGDLELETESLTINRGSEEWTLTATIDADTAIYEFTATTAAPKTETIAPRAATWGGDAMNGYLIECVTTSGTVQIVLMDNTAYGMGWMLSLSINDELLVEGATIDAPTWVEDNLVLDVTVVSGTLDEYTIQLTATPKPATEIIANATMALSEDEYEVGTMIVSATWEEHPLTVKLNGWPYYGYGEYAEANLIIEIDPENYDVVDAYSTATLEKKEDVAVLTGTFSHWDGNKYALTLTIAEPAAAPVVETVNVVCTDMVQGEEWGTPVLTGTCNLGDINISLNLEDTDHPESVYGEYGFAEYPTGLFPAVEVTIEGEDSFIMLELMENTVAVYTDGDTQDSFVGTFLGSDWKVYVLDMKTPDPEGPSAVDNITTTVAPVKAIVNGQLVIVKDGVQYNAQGAVIK